MYNQPLEDRRLVACRNCDLVQRLPDLSPGESARCPRCESELLRPARDSLERTLAMAIAAAVLYVVANAVPMLGLAAAGEHQFVTVLGGAEHLWQSGWILVAVLVLITAVIAPFLRIAFVLAISVGARAARPPGWVRVLLRHHPTARTWSMIEVMLLGVLVALLKIAEYARVIPGTGLYLLGALIVLLAAIQATFDPLLVWERVEWADEDARRERGAALPVAEEPA